MGRPAKLAKELMEVANKNADQEIAKQVEGISSQKMRASSLIRRSRRLNMKKFQSMGKMVKENLDEGIRVLDSQKEDGHANIVRKIGLPDQQKTGKAEVRKTKDGRSLEEKVEYLLKAVDELKSKVFNDQCPRNNPLEDQKSIDSQTEIGYLKEENNQLCKKLDIALGKVEAYCEGNRLLVDTLKDVILSPNLAKTLLLPSETHRLQNREDQVAGVAPGEGSPVVAKKRGRKPRQVVFDDGV